MRHYARAETVARTSLGSLEFFAEKVGRASYAGLMTPPPQSAVQCISAVTLATTEMARAIRFYKALGFAERYGGKDASFTSFRAGPGYLNLTTEAPGHRPAFWGRVIFHVDDVDAMYARAIAQGIHPDTSPSDASWGERYFHITDPDGHQLSFAKPIEVRY